MTQGPAAGHPRGRAALLPFVVLAFLCGALVAVQSRINGQLGIDTGDGFVAALISFGSGLAIIALVLVVSAAGRRGIRTVVAAVRDHEIPWWHAAGGFAGGLFVLSQGLYAGGLGIALFTVAIVAGQTISGLVIDSRGIGRVAPRPVTVPRIIGAALALVAVVIAVLPQVGGHLPVLVTILPFAIGLLLGVQQALNAQVKTLARSATTATAFNFLAGTLLLAVFVAVNVVIVGVPHYFPTNPALYSGGLIGVLFIAGFAAATPVIGVLLQSLAAVSGQLIMALALDFIAPTDDLGVGIATIVGTVLTLVAVAVASIPGRSAGQSAAGPNSPGPSSTGPSATAPKGTAQD